MKKNKIVAAMTAAALAIGCGNAWAQNVTAQAGYIYEREPVGGLTQSCVAAGPGGTFVSVGPGFSGAAQEIRFVTESGGARLVASGFNSVGDCAYDRAADILYVTDNGLEATGAFTGDTVFAIPSASVASSLSTLGLELAPAGSIPDAASVTLDGQGTVFVSEASGGGAGSVQQIKDGVMSPFIAGGFDFTAGLIFNAAGELLVAETLDSFANQISRYDASGSFVGLLSDPTFEHGSFDLAFDLDGRLLVTGAYGGDVVAISAGGVRSSFASGLTFATGVDVDPFTGRVQIISSSFTGADEDSSLHRFTPVDRLVAGRGRDKSECVSEFYGLRLLPRKPGKPAKKAICHDGQACDADGSLNGSCLFPLGICLAVTDSRFPSCSSGGVAAFAMKSKPPSAVLEQTRVAILAALPVAAPACFFSDGVTVAVRLRRNGRLKPGKARVKVKAVSDDAKPLRDRDVVKLVCRPALP